MVADVFKEQFCKRLAALRFKADVSAREMSLAIGQDAGYINSIENQRMLPSMTVFGYICDYLSITPKEFFDYENDCPAKTERLLRSFRSLTPEQRSCLVSISDWIKPK